MGASRPHLKEEKSIPVRLGWRATNFAAHTLRLVFSLKVCFQTSWIPRGAAISPPGPPPPQPVEHTPRPSPQAAAERFQRPVALRQRCRVLLRAHAEDRAEECQ